MSAPARRSIRLVILPFTAHEGDDDFGSGLTEELIAQLGHRGAGRVHVVARISTLACTGTAQRASDVGAALGADYLLEGGVRCHGGRVRIAVWLVDAREEVQTWSEVYEREVAESLPAQIEVASSIAQSIIDTVIAAGV